MTADHGAFDGLKPVSAETLAQFDEVASEVENTVVKDCMDADDPASKMGPEAEPMMRNGLGFVTRMLRSSMKFAAEGILENELEWGKTRLPVYGVSPQMVMDNFQRYSRALEDKLPPQAFAEMKPYMDGMMKMQGDITGTHDE